MNRSKPLKRKKGLTADPAKVRDFVDRNRKPIRSDPEKRRAFANQRSELAAESDKRKKERPQRAAVRKATRERAGDRCQGADVWPEIKCWGPIDTDEKASRGVRPGSHLESELTQALCRGHHDARHAFPNEARRRGLRLRSTDVGPDGKPLPIEGDE